MQRMKLVGTTPDVNIHFGGKEKCTHISFWRSKPATSVKGRFVNMAEELYLSTSGVA